MVNGKVLVTGGLGMVGSHVTRALVASGRRPVVYDAGSDTHLIADVAAHCDIVQGAIEDLPRLMGLAREHHPTAILHFAGRIGAGVDQFPWSSLQTNLLGTVTVFECARLWVSSGWCSRVRRWCTAMSVSSIGIPTTRRLTRRIRACPSGSTEN